MSGFRRRCCRFTVRTILTVACLFAAAGILDETRTSLRAQGFRPITLEDEQREKEEQQSLDEITAREVNQLHAAILERILVRELHKQDLSVRYGGIVCRTSLTWKVTLPGTSIVKRGGSYIVGDLGSPLAWTFQSADGSTVFRMWVSTRKTPQTAGSITLKRELFLNVPDVDEKGNRVDEQMPALGGRSIREILIALNKPTEDM